MLAAFAISGLAGRCGVFVDDQTLVPRDLILLRRLAWTPLVSETLLSRDTRTV